MWDAKRSLSGFLLDVKMRAPEWSERPRFLTSFSHKDFPRSRTAVYKMPGMSSNQSRALPCERHRNLWALTLALLLSGVSILDARDPPPPGAATSQGSSLSGKVTDETGAVMQSVDVLVFEGDATEPIAVTTTDGEGLFTLALPDGEYRMEVAAPAFATFIETVRVGAGMEPLPVTLALDIVREEIEVDTGREELSVADTSMSLTSQRLSGDELLDLPDNEEDLAMYLLMLAGADTTGDLEQDVLSSFIIDGFDNGRLPSLDQIAQIIVDPNSLSADGGGPRIEIVTRPGTGRWRRSVDFSFADESLNALTPGERSKVARQTRNFNIEFGGPIIPNLLEMDFELVDRNNERAANSLRAITPAGSFFEGVVRPQLQRSIEIEGEVELAGNHSLDIGFEYQRGARITVGSEGSACPNAGPTTRTASGLWRSASGRSGKTTPTTFKFR